MKIIESIIATVISCLIFYMGYFFVFIAPVVQSEMEISRGDLETLTKYKLKHPEFVGPLCKKALSDSFITRKEYCEIVGAVKNYEESLLYKQLTE